MPTTVVPLQPASSVSDKITSGVALVATSAPTIAAPLLSSINPALNPTGAGGLAVALIGGGIVCIVQALAVQDWFDDHHWAVWLCIILACVICGGLYIVLLHDVEKGVLNALGAMYESSSKYGPLKGLGVFNRGEEVSA